MAALVLRHSEWLPTSASCLCPCTVDANLLDLALRKGISARASRHRWKASPQRLQHPLNRSLTSPNKLVVGSPEALHLYAPRRVGPECDVLHALQQYRFSHCSGPLTSNCLAWSRLAEGLTCVSQETRRSKVLLVRDERALDADLHIRGCYSPGTMSPFSIQLSLMVTI